MAAECPMCGREVGRPAITIGATPVHQHVTAPSEQEALQCLRGDVALTLCRHCSFVFNATFDPRLVDYSPGYENSQNCSGVFSSYLDWIIDDLRCRYDLRSKRVVEAGCGQGTFLERLVDRTDCVGVGFDPSFDRDRRTIRPDLHFITDRFDPHHPDAVGDVVYARHVIEHLMRPRDLTSDAARSSAGRGGAVWLETPRLEWILERRAYWDIFYEHCSYFFMPVLASMMAACGLRVTHHASTFGDQYQWIEGASDAAPPTAADPSAFPRARDGLLLENALRAFAAGWPHWRDAWRTRLELASARGECILWGAGAKGVTFLNHLDASRDLVSAVVDINPRKQDRFIAGTGQPIVAPAALAGREVATVLVANSIYAGEIERTLRALECNALVVLLEPAA
jgi:SAM-dependent methyltransferase